MSEDKCSYGLYCTKSEPCVYCERDRLKEFVRKGALLHFQGALPNSFAVQDYLKGVWELMEGKDG